MNRPEHNKHTDKNSTNILIISNFITCFSMIIRLIGAGLDQDDNDCHTTVGDEHTDLATAIIGFAIKIAFTLSTTFIPHTKVYIKYSAEVSIGCLALSFPYHALNGGASLVIQYVQFQITSIFVISFQYSFFGHYKVCSRIVSHVFVFWCFAEKFAIYFFQWNIFEHRIT